jgi:hypothetical protein
MPLKTQPRESSRHFRWKVPVDPTFDEWTTYRVRRRVLVVVRSVVTITRLLDILSLFDDDHRIQPVFTFDPHRRALLGAGLEESLADLGVHVMPWRQALRAEFDLAIAASENDALAELTCPVLLVPHGIGYQKYYPNTTTVAGLNPERLRGNQIRVGLSHANQLGHLHERDAADRAVVIGDPCHDRMLTSAHRAPHIRRMLGIGRRGHIVLASTWGPESLIGANPLLPHRFLAELPWDEYRVSLVLHPGAWAAHKENRIHANLSAALRAGLTLIPPQRGWQATLLAADCVVSDCGSLSLYAAAARVPVVFGVPPADTVVADSPLSELVTRAPRLDDSDLATQLKAAISSGPVAGLSAVDYPGKCAELLRPLLYELLNLPEPEYPAAFPLTDDPVPKFTPPTTFRVGVTSQESTGKDSTENNDTLVVRRFPAAVPGSPLPGQHVVAHAELATLAELEGAAILYRTADDDFPAWAAAIARRRPSARLVAEIAPGLCRIWVDGTVTELPADGVDPLLLASAAHWRIVRGLDLKNLRLAQVRP